MKPVLNYILIPVFICSFSGAATGADLQSPRLTPKLSPQINNKESGVRNETIRKTLRPDLTIINFGFEADGSGSSGGGFILRSIPEVSRCIQGGEPYASELNYIRVKCNMYAVVKNRGSIESSATSLTFKYNNAPTGRTAKWVRRKMSVPSLRPNQEKRVRITLATRPISRYVNSRSGFRIEVDPDNRVKESRENNNKKNIPLN